MATTGGASVRDTCRFYETNFIFRGREKQDTCQEATLDIRGKTVAEAAIEVALEEKKMLSNPWPHPEFWPLQANLGKTGLNE